MRLIAECTNKGEVNLARKVGAVPALSPNNFSILWETPGFGIVGAAGQVEQLLPAKIEGLILISYTTELLKAAVKAKVPVYGYIDAVDPFPNDTVWHHSNICTGYIFDRACGFDGMKLLRRNYPNHKLGLHNPGNDGEIAAVTGALAFDFQLCIPRANLRDMEAVRALFDLQRFGSLKAGPAVGNPQPLRHQTGG